MRLTAFLLILSSFFTFALADPVALALAFPDPTVPNLPAGQTIVPFATLPACSQQCGKLFDVQGACSPPNVDASNTKTCFCADPRLTPFESGTAGPCDQAGCDAADLSTIQKWYKTLCAGASATTGATTTSTGAAGATSTSSGSSSGSSDGNATWMSTHVKAVIMLVVLIVVIVGGWIGAYCLRKRYLKRKDREYELRSPATTWVAGKSHSPYGDGVVDSSKEARSSVLSPPAPVKGKGTNGESYDAEKVQKKKWTVHERT